MASQKPPCIIYPIFEDCASFTMDSFWKEQFINFARNRFPQGVRYDSNHGNLILKLPGAKGTEVVALSQNSSVDTFQIVMRVLREKLGMRSTRDLKIQKQEMEDIRQQRMYDMNCDWKQLRPRHLRDQLVMDYIGSLKEKYGLTATETKNLVSIIQLGFQFHSLSQDDVDYQEGKVVNINGLTFDKKTRTFSVPEPSKTSAKSEKNSVSNKFQVTADKFLRENTNRKNKYAA